MERPFEQILNSARQYLKEAGALTLAFNEQLNNLSDLEEAYQAIRKTQNEGDERAEALANVCKSIVRGNYLPLKFSTTGLSKTVSNMDEEASKFPKPIQPLVKEMRSYLTSLEKTFDEIDDLLNEIQKKIKGASERKYVISEEEKKELHLLAFDVEANLTIAENYDKRAHKAMNSLQEEITSYQQDQKVSAIVKTIAVAAVGAVVGGAGVAIAGLAGAASLAGAAGAAKVAGGGAAGASVFGATKGLHGTFSYFGEYNNLKAKRFDLKRELEILAAKEEEKRAKLKAARKGIDTLERKG